jgi:NAD+ kinase
MKLGLFANIKKPHVREVLGLLCSWAKNRDLTFLACQPLSDFLDPAENILEEVSESAFIRNSEMILAMGGDGTMLAAARLIGDSETPLLGVNLGGLGFLAEVSANDLYHRLDSVLKGEAVIQKRMVLDAQFQTSGRSYQLNALNDVVIHRGGTSRILKIELHVNQQYFNTYHADGLIIATPTGSTAYSLSSSGPILMPEMEGMILNPICPHTLTARPVVIPGDDRVSIRVLPTDHAASLTIDGQVHLELDEKTEITVRKAGYSIHSVSFSDSSFFDVLRKKLRWGDTVPRTS